MEQIVDTKYKLLHIHLELYFLKPKMMKITDIYDSITVYLLQMILG